MTVTRTHTVTTTLTVTTGGGSTASAPCTGGDVSGSFDLVQGSAGAGQTSYRLTLTNSSSGACFVSGVPGLQLLDASGADLPTHVVPAQPGQGTAARIVLQPGDSATADARFSPDVPGTGDRQNGPCQPKAARLLVTLSSGAQTVPINPPTRVCEQGTLNVGLFTAAG